MAGTMKRVSLTEQARSEILAQVDWAALNAKSAAEIDAARRADPDAIPPMTDEQIDAAKGESIRRVRLATGLTQAAFASRYGIPLGTLRDWEQGKSVPDATARTYLRVIEKAPAAVAAALEGAAA